MHGRQAIWMTALALSVALAVPGRVSAASVGAFQATIAETETVAPCSPLIPSRCVTIRGTGHATTMGPIQEVAFVVTDLASNAGVGCDTELRETILTAANGDRLALDATGVNCATGKMTRTAVDTYQVVGGTGQYSGAHGNGTITAQIVIGKTALVTMSGLLSLPSSPR